MIASWPADDLRFRTSRGSRWYRDSLPPCDLVPDADPSTPFECPAWTTVANAWPKFLTNWSAGQAAIAAVDQHDEWQAILDTDGRDAAVRWVGDAHNRNRDQAAARGTGIHRLLEQIAAGHAPAVDLFPDAAAFVATMKRFVAETKPRWVCSEVVTFNRRIAVAGTADGFLTFDKLPELGARIVDFKTKAHKDKVDCYPDHALQVVLHANADYVVANVDGKPTRVAVPEVAGGLIVIITQHDYHLFPIETGDTAYPMVCTLRDMWDVTRDAKRLIAKPVKPDTLPTVDLLAERAFLVERIGWLKAEHPAAVEEIVRTWPFGIPTLKASNDHTAEQLALLRKVVEQAEATCRVPFHGEEPSQPPVSDTEIAGVSHGPNVGGVSGVNPGVAGDGEANLSAPASLLDGQVEAVPPAASLPVGGIDDDPRPVAEDVDYLIARLTALPADLFATVEGTAKAAGVPNLRKPEARVSHLHAVEVLINVAEVEWAQRKRLAAEHLASAVGDDDDMAKALLKAAGAPNVDLLMEGQAETLHALCLAVIGDVLMMEVLDGGAWSLRCADNVGEDYFVEICGSKAAALEVAKEVAAALEVQAPRSTAAIASQPVVAAVVATRARVAA